MPLIKGIKISHLQSFVSERAGDGYWEQVLSTLRPEERARVEVADPEGWQPLSLVSRLRIATQETLGDREGTMMRALGRYEAEREFSSIHRWFLRLIDPWYAMGHMDIYWRRSHDSGLWESQVGKREVLATLSEHEDVGQAACLRTLGFLDRTLDGLGFDVERLDHPECRDRGHERCVYRATLAAAPKRRRSSHGRITMTELAQIGRELTYYPTLDGLVDAVVLLLHTCLGFDRVLLWHGDEQGLTLTRVAGEANVAIERCHVLVAAGRSVGRIEVGTRRPYERSVRHRMLEELVPWISLAIDRLARPVGDSPLERTSSRSSRSWFVARLEQLRIRSSLTRRQTQVLQHLVCGQSNKDISAALGCSDGTVELHVTQVLQKCKVDNRSMLTALFWSDLDDPAAVVARCHD